MQLAHLSRMEEAKRYGRMAVSDPEMNSWYARLAASLALALFSCKKSDDSGSGTTGTVPTLLIENVSGITKTSAWAGGQITSTGGLTVKSKGICWNTADSSTVVWSVKDNGMYEGYLWFPANTQYKYTRGNSMTENYGDNNQDGTLELNGANIEATAEGYYKLNVDLPDLTHALMKTSWSARITGIPG